MKKIYNFLNKINLNLEANRSIVSSSLFKTFAITLAMLVVGIGGVWGQTPDQTYSSGSNTFTIPAGVSAIQVKVWGGGGAGGGSANNNNGGSGGGSGAYTIKTFSVTSGQVYNYVVGVGGTFGAAGNSPGNPGGESSFKGPNPSTTHNLIAGGGGGGSSNLGAAGSGGNTSGGVAGSANGNSGTVGGASGQIGGSAPNGGIGGAALTNNHGNPGVAPGGGGGGGEKDGSTNRYGGTGGTGRIEIYYFYGPSISSLSSSSYCSAGGQTVTITGTNFTGATAVTFNGVAAASFSVTNSTTISAVTPANVTAGVITVTTAGGSANSSSYTVTATPEVPIVSVSGGSTINVGGTTTLTSSTGANTLWYTVASGGSSVGSGDNFTTLVQCASGSITYYAEGNNGTCTSSSRTAISITVRSIITSNPANALICTSGGSVILSTQLTGASGITWSPNTNLSTTSGSSTVASPNTTTVYTMNATVTGCGSVSGTQTVGVIDAVAFTPTSTPTAVCAGNPAVLASNLSSSGFTYSTTTFSMASPSSPTNLASAGAANVALTSGTLDDGGWQNIPIGFSFNFFGNNYSTLNVGTNGVLQFGSYNSTALGDYTYATAFPTVTEPTNIIAAAANDYYAVVSGTIRYWTQGITPTRIFVAEWNAVPGYTTNGSMTVQVKLFETTGSVEIHVQNASSTNNKVVGLQNANASVGATAYSNTATITNQAWKFVPGANYSFQWSTAGSNIGGATATTYTTPELNTPGTVTYTVAATNPNTQCASTANVSVTVNARPAAPVSAGNVTACSNAGSQNLVVTTSSGITGDWFAASSAGTVLSSPSNGTGTLSYSIPSPSSTITYFAEARNTTTGCTSTTRTGVTLTVNNAPAAPTASGVTYCQGATSSPLIASVPVGSNTQNWYNVSTGGTPLAGAPTPSTATATTLTFYVSGVSGTNGCESSRTSVTAIINPTPIAPASSNPSPYCQNASATALSATASGGNTLLWYTVSTGGTGSTTAITPSTSSAGTTDYYVSQRTASNCESPRTTISVTVNPSITASVTNSASSTSACGGGSITFTATPTNGGTPTYQWKLNGANVGTNSNTYTLSSPASGNEIKVVMTPSTQTCLTSTNPVESNVVTLTSSAETPAVTIQSTASSAICPGASVTFSVNSSANMGATPTYQWNLNGLAISGATNASLVNTTLVNNDQVTLTMTSSLDSNCVTQQTATSSTITTTVNAATAISSQPTAAAACLGGSQNFTVSATGTGALTYQWKKNGSNVTANATATQATLTLSGIAAGDATNYTADVTGTCGMLSSNTAALSINSVTAISAQPTAVTQCAGTTANFSVTGSGQGTLSYQWRKDGVALNGETNASLTIANIATGNAGQYSVIVTAGCGNVTSSNALLTVNSSTAIATQPVAATLCAGNTTNFSVTASGTGALSYQWKKDGSNVGTNSSSLSVANTQAVDAGTYTVDVSSTCGLVTSNNTLLTVNPLTTISTQPVGTAGCEGQNTTFTVVAAGTGALSYQWKYGATNVGTNSTSYNIPSTSNANDGNYSVIVTGTCGNTTSNTVSLNVYLSPTTAATISTADITDGTLCGKNTVAVAANSPGVESIGQWSVVDGVAITPANASATSTTFTAANSALGGAAKKLVWSHIRTTNGNNCFTRDTITVDFKQPLTTGSSTVFTNNSFLWSGLTNSSWSTSSNWYQFSGGDTGKWEKITTGEPIGTSNVYILNNVNDVCVNTSNIPTLGNGEVTNNVFNAQGAQLNLSNGNLTLSGNFTNNGTINPGSGTVTFNGSSNQTITGSGAIANLNNVIVNKSSGTLILDQPTRIDGNLTLTNGNIITDSTNILEIGSGVNNPGSVTWSNGSIQGPLKRWYSAASNLSQESGIFPVGTATHNRNAIINFTSNSIGGYVIVNFVAGLPTAGENPYNLPLTYVVNGTNNYIQNADVTGYWEIIPYNVAGVAYGSLDDVGYCISLRINNTDFLVANPVTSNSSAMRLLKAKGYANGTHDPFTVASASATVTAVGSSTTDFNVFCNGLSGFSFFGMGGDNETPLPVELTEFIAVAYSDWNTIKWVTTSENNSDYYSLLSSVDGESWIEIHKQNAAGNSTEELKYFYIDYTKKELTYYKLVQFDKDGKNKIYGPILAQKIISSKIISKYTNILGQEININEFEGVIVVVFMDGTTQKIIR